MYSKLSILDAMGQARADGFEGIECRSPFEHPKEVVRSRLDELGLTLVQFNCPMGNFSAGDRGLACLIGREDEFRASIELTRDYAVALGVGQVNCVGGLRTAGKSDGVIEEVFVRNLRYAAPVLADAGIKLQIEPINSIDTPGVFLTSTKQFSRIYERVGHQNLYLQYDFYHMQIMQGDLIRKFDELSRHINHIQIADNPGRHEPGTGEINYDFILGALDARGYSGWVGCEYQPLTTAAGGLDWRRRWI